MATGYTEGEIERLRRDLAAARQELAEERARKAVWPLRVEMHVEARVEKFRPAPGQNSPQG